MARFKSFLGLAYRVSHFAVFMAVTAPSHAADLWLKGQTEGADGETVCVYSKFPDNVYRPAELGDYCPMTISDE